VLIKETILYEFQRWRKATCYALQGGHGNINVHYISANTSTADVDVRILALQAADKHHPPVQCVTAAPATLHRMETYSRVAAKLRKTTVVVGASETNVQNLQAIRR